METLEVVKFSNEAQLPTRAHDDDAGLDLYSPLEFTIEPSSKVDVSLGIGVGIRPGYVGIVYGRSSFIARGIYTPSGVIDPGYVGAVKVSLVNLSKEPHHVVAGDRIAQLVLMRTTSPEVVEVEKLPESARGTGGFGSTGA